MRQKYILKYSLDLNSSKEKSVSRTTVPSEESLRLEQYNQPRNSKTPRCSKFFVNEFLKTRQVALGGDVTEEIPISNSRIGSNSDNLKLVF